MMQSYAIAFADIVKLMFSFERVVALKIMVDNLQAFTFSFQDPLMQKAQCFPARHH